MDNNEKNLVENDIATPSLEPLTASNESENTEDISSIENSTTTDLDDSPISDIPQVSEEPVISEDTSEPDSNDYVKTEVESIDDSLASKDANIPSDLPLSKNEAESSEIIPPKKNQNDKITKKPPKEKHRIIKSKNTPEYLPGMQKKLFVDVRDEDEMNFFDKIKYLFTNQVFLLSGIIYAFVILDLIGLSMLSKNLGLSISQSLLYKLHFDSLSLHNYTFLEMSIFASYIFAFIFGGLITFIMLKLAFLILKKMELMYSHNITRVIMLVFMLIFAIFTIYSFVTTGSLLTIETYNWLIGLFTLIGGFCMYSISLRNVEIY